MKDKILEKIKKEEIKMKPKWWFLGIRWSRKVAWTVILAGIVIWGVIETYLASIRVKKEFLEFGVVGKEMFWDNVPILMFLGILISLGLLTLIWGKIGNNYKKDKKQRLFLNLGLILTGLILFWIILKMFELEIGLWLI
jgi:hypothetical protein